MTAAYNDISAIRARDAARSPGPWSTRDPHDSWRDDYCGGDYCGEGHTSGRVEIPELLDDDGNPMRFCGERAEANAAFVAEATVWTGSLCDEVERLRTQRDSLLALAHAALAYQRARVAAAMHPRSISHRDELRAAGIGIESALRKAGLIK